MRAQLGSCMCALAAGSVVWAASAPAASTIDPAHPYAYGANVGWGNFRGDAANGAVLGQSYCTGFVYAANCGWICLGNTPANGWHYSNAAANDWGVNHDGQGKLTGYAYGANVGWINFEQAQGLPKIDLLTGNLSGHAYGANIGWISLSNAVAFVRTDRLDSGPDTDGDRLPDPFEYRHTNTLFALDGRAGADRDGDGATDLVELGADTDPLDPASHLELRTLARLGDTNRLVWTIQPTRFYRLEQATALTSGAAWADSGLGRMTPDPGETMTREVAAPVSAARFFRVEAVVPLSE